MAMDQSALLDLLAALKDTDVSDRIRTATEHLYQELIDAEVTAVIGAGPWQRTTESRSTGSPARRSADLSASWWSGLLESLEKNATLRAGGRAFAEHVGDGRGDVHVPGPIRRPSGCHASPGEQERGLHLVGRSVQAVWCCRRVGARGPPLHGVDDKLTQPGAHPKRRLLTLVEHLQDLRDLCDLQ